MTIRIFPLFCALGAVGLWLFHGGCGGAPSAPPGSSLDLAAATGVDAGGVADANASADLSATVPMVCPALQSGVPITPDGTTAPTCADALLAPTSMAYAAGADHTLDLRRPRGGGGPFPLVIWIHGGGWKSGSRSQVEQARRLVCKGYAVASIDYRLSGTATFPAQIYDVKAAIRYLRANAAANNLDPARFVTFGSSAGGHLANLAATSGGVADLEDLTMGNATTSSAVQAGVVWYGPSDIGQMDAELLAQGCAGANHGLAGSAESDFLGCTVNSAACAPAIRRANPTTYVGPSTPPLLLLHGTSDCVVPNAQSTLVKQAMDAAQRCAIRRDVVGAAHGGPEWESTPVQDTVAPFLDAVLKR